MARGEYSGGTLTVRYARLSTTALGDWYVKRIVVDRHPLLILVSSASLLAIVASRPYADGCDTSPIGFIEAWLVAEDTRRATVIIRPV